MMVTRDETVTSLPIFAKDKDRLLVHFLEFCRELKEDLNNFGIEWEYQSDPNWVVFTATRRNR